MPTVIISSPTQSNKIGQNDASNTVDLPGRLEAFSKASLFARVSGYLTSWSVDIGDRVKAGQVLAEIETPDLDQQILQAQAEWASTKAIPARGRRPSWPTYQVSVMVTSALAVMAKIFGNASRQMVGKIGAEVSVFCKIIDCL